MARLLGAELLRVRHGHDVVAAVDEMDLSGNARRQRRQEVERRPADLVKAWDSIASEIERLFDRAVTPRKFTVASLPPAALNEGLQVYVSDESGGAVLAFSDGTDWRRSTDRAVAS